jgi:ribosomal protein L1
MSIGKRLKKSYETVDRNKFYPISDAIRLVKQNATS